MERILITVLTVVFTCISSTMLQGAISVDDVRENLLKSDSLRKAPYINKTGFVNSENELLITATDSFLQLDDVAKAEFAKGLLEKLTKTDARVTFYITVYGAGGEKVLYGQINPHANAIIVNLTGRDPFIWSLRTNPHQVTNALEPAPHRCMTCGRIIGAEAPESQLSRDKDFKSFGMFQQCNDCFVKSFRGNKEYQEAAIRKALQHKWESIRHNLKVKIPVEKQALVRGNRITLVR